MVQALKERLVERANIIQARHDAETAALVKRQVRASLHCTYMKTGIFSVQQPQLQAQLVVCGLTTFLCRLTSSVTETK